MKTHQRLDGVHRRRTAFLAGALLMVVALVTFASFESGPAGAQAQVVPANTVEPSISGVVTVGSTLTATDGTWSNSPTSFTRQWVRCPSSGGASDGSDCAAISGATTSAYVAGAGDVGFTLRIRITASNSDGSATVASNATAVVTATAAPTNAAQPAVSGTTVQGQTLSGTNGTWSGTTPITYAYQWVRCGADGGASDGSNCVSISGATGTSYTLQSADVGYRLRLRVTATNSVGSRTAASNATATIAVSTLTGTPSVTQQPTITGTTVQGKILTGRIGTWSGTTPITYARQWVRCGTDGGASDGSNCTVIAGATGAGYTLQASDVGYRLRVRVTATNAAGSATAASNATATITSPTPTPAPTPTPTTVVSISSVSLPQRLVIDRVQFTPNPVRTLQTTVQLRVHIADTRGYGISGALVFARSTPILTTTPPEQATGPDGWATLTFLPRLDFPLEPGHSVQFFIRARKPGEYLLAGVSTRRLVQVATAR